jgi:hypothetical protein
MSGHCRQVRKVHTRRDHIRWYVEDRMQQTHNITNTRRIPGQRVASYTARMCISASPSFSAMLVPKAWKAWSSQFETFQE